MIEVGGPENLTFNQVVELFEKAGGRPVKTNHVPLPIMRAMCLLILPFNPLLSLQITGDIVMETENQACEMSATLQQYPVKLIHLEEIARRMVERASYKPEAG